MCVFCPTFDSDGSSDCPGFSEMLTDVKGAVMIDYSQAMELFREEEDVVGVYCIATGRVGLFKKDRQGGRSLLAVARPGDLLGAPDLLSRHPHSTTAEAYDDVRVWFIPDAQFRELVAARPVVIVNVMRRVCQQLAELDRKLENVPSI